MIICVCKGVSDSHVKQAASRGHCTMQKLKCQTGLGSQCGVCRKSTRQLLSEINRLSNTALAPTA